MAQRALTVVDAIPGWVEVVVAIWAADPDAAHYRHRRWWRCCRWWSKQMGIVRLRGVLRAPLDYSDSAAIAHERWPTRRDCDRGAPRVVQTRILAVEQTGRLETIDVNRHRAVPLKALAPTAAKGAGGASDAPRLIVEFAIENVRKMQQKPPLLFHQK